MGESDISDDAVELITSFCPEVVLLDIGLPLLTGLNLRRQITQHLPASSVVIRAAYDDDEQLFQAIKSGAAGYLSKNATSDEMASAIRKIHRGEQTIKNHMTSILRKLDANDRTQAVVMAMHYGWISSRVVEPSEPITRRLRED